MKKTLGFYLAAFLILCPTFVLAQEENSKKPKDTLEQKIRKLDLAQADAILRKDFQALDKLCAKDFIVNNPRGEISQGNEAVKELIRSGVINYASFAREIETVLIHGKTIVIMGRETLVPNENSLQAGQTVRRRYTNIWMKRSGKWLLTARHASVVAEKIQSGQTENKPQIAPNQETEARQTVQSFFDAFNSHDFGRAAEYTTEDWTHINPFGGQTSGREAVLKELKEVHNSFLKGVSMTVEDMSVRFAAPDTAVVTVTNKIGIYTTPDAVKHENERQIKTVVVVKRSGKWLIMQDQNTIINR